MEKQRVRFSVTHAVVWCLIAGGLLAGYMVYGASAQRRIWPSNGPDFFYPNVPSGAPMPKAPVLRRSATVEGIVAWAEKECRPLVEYHSASGSRRFFIVMDEMGSGMYVWRYILYAQGVSAKAQHEWEAVATGFICSAVKCPVVRCAYIDEPKRDLVFVGVDGKEIRRVRLPGALWKDRVAAPGSR